MLLKRIFSRLIVCFLGRKYGQTNQKRGQKSIFSTFFFHIRNLLQKLHKPTKFQKNRIKIRFACVYHLEHLTSILIKFFKFYNFFVLKYVTVIISVFG